MFPTLKFDEVLLVTAANRDYSKCISIVKVPVRHQDRNVSSRHAYYTSLMRSVQNWKDFDPALASRRVLLDREKAQVFPFNGHPGHDLLQQDLVHFLARLLGSCAVRVHEFNILFLLLLRVFLEQLRFI